MKPALYLSCALLIGPAFHAQSTLFYTHGGVGAIAHPFMPASGYDGATDFDAQAPTPAPPSAQNSTGQNSNAQEPTPQDALAAQVNAVQKEVVSLNDEPHHLSLLQNEFVHVYSVSVPPLDATLIHKHELPYLAVSLGATDVKNAVVGKPETYLSLQDGQVTYVLGGFAHALRTDAGVVFRSVTMELAKPQGAARNVCKQIVPGPLACPQEAAKGKKPAAEAADDDLPYFETDELRVDVMTVSAGRDYVDATPKQNALLVALTNAALDVNLAGEHTSFLHGGDVVWLPVGTHRRVVDFLGTHSSFLLVSFKDSAGVTQ
jgi:hypothetical protein